MEEFGNEGIAHPYSLLFDSSSESKTSSSFMYFSCTAAVVLLSKLTKELCEVIEDFGLDKESVTNLVKLIDKIGGYIFQGIDAKKLDLRLTAIHLIDSHLCSDPGKYVSALLLTLSTMLHMELPHVNVLSKMDLIESYGKLAFNLDFYTDVEDLSYLQNHLDQDPRSSKYRKLTKELCEVIEDFGLVNFSTLAIQECSFTNHFI
nr:GPN-loop GTPase 2 [Tanacetum cinerariifolium]